MTNPELSIPPLSLTERLTFCVADVLKNSSWDPKPQSGLDVRERIIVLDSEQLVKVRQVRTPTETKPIIANSVRLEIADRQFLARWLTDDTKLGINDFRYTDDIESVLNAANEVRMKQDGEA